MTVYSKALLARLKQADEMMQAGASQDKACRALGVTFNQVSHYRKTHSPHRIKRPTVPLETRLAIAQAVHRGGCKREIGERFCVSRTTLDRFYTQYLNGAYDELAAPESEPNVPQGGSYIVQGRHFATKEDAIRHCVQLAGGIQRIVTESVEI